MADFSTVLKPTNNTLDIYCRSVHTDTTDAYAILSSTITAVLVTPGSPVLINWASSPNQIYKNIVISGGNTLFTLTEIGTYLIDMSVALDVVSNAGAQNSVSLLVNGVSGTFDVGFSNSTVNYVYKGTIKGYVVKIVDVPLSVSFQVSTLVQNAQHRYAQLSIVKID